jgi:hypothetical protein
MAWFCPCEPPNWLCCPPKPLPKFEEEDPKPPDEGDPNPVDDEPNAEAPPNDELVVALVAPPNRLGAGLLAVAAAGAAVVVAGFTAFACEAAAASAAVG